MEKDNGGQAFPSRQISDCNGIPFEYTNEGMTVRDYFMTHAPEMPEWFEKWRDHYTIERAYFDWRRYYADSMIVERNKNN